MILEETTFRVAGCLVCYSVFDVLGRGLFCEEVAFAELVLSAFEDVAPPLLLAGLQSIGLCQDTWEEDVRDKENAREGEVTYRQYARLRDRLVEPDMPRSGSQYHL